MPVKIRLPWKRQIALDQDMSYQIVARKFLGNVAKFGGICFNI